MRIIYGNCIALYQIMRTLNFNSELLSRLIATVSTGKKIPLLFYCYFVSVDIFNEYD